MPVPHPSGNYSFVPGIAPYSCGVISEPGFELIHVTLQQPLPWRDGFDQIDAVLQREQRPRASLCAISLRSPRPFSFSSFAAFNADYEQVLRAWGVFAGDLNPVARTNVAPVAVPPGVASLHGFAFSRRCAASLPATFVVAGAGELPEGKLCREDIHQLGDTSANGLLSKARFVMDLMSRRLTWLGTSWSAVNRINVYTAHPLHDIVSEIIEPAAGSAARHGVTWFHSRPPIDDIEFEMDLRGTRTELII
jgi:hypothetical protein